MLTGLPQIFDKAFVIGFLLPVMIGACGLAFVFPDLPGFELLRNPKAEDKLGNTFYLLFVMSLAAVGLMMTNDLQTRLLSGYALRGRLRRWLLARESAVQAEQEKVSDALFDRRRALKAAGGTLSEADRASLYRAQKLLVTHFPPPGHLMPTRFGNVVRAVELYPFTVYGVDSVQVWARLIAVVPKDFAAVLNDLRAQVNCLVNLVFILGLLGAAAVVAAVLDTPWEALFGRLRYGDLAGPPVSRVFLIGVGALAGAALAYKALIERTVAWGQSVKAAFDCYLPALLTQLGYETPDRDSERAVLWADLNKLFVYHSKLPADRWPRTSAKHHKSG